MAKLALNGRILSLSCPRAMSASDLRRFRFVGSATRLRRGKCGYCDLGAL